MKKLLLIFLLVLLFPSLTLARSGCCSYHGGVSSDGCGCNDGSPLSSTCAPYYSCTRSAQPIYVPPISTPTPMPKITASMVNDYNSIRNIYSIKFDWSDVPGSYGYSVSISKYPGADPGPLSDTMKSVWRFNNLKAGTWYINLKYNSIYNSGWSNVSYWTIDLPNAETRTVK